MGTSGEDGRAGLSAPAPGGGIRKRSVVIGGHATSVSVEQPFWDGLRRIARERGVSVNALLGEIDRANAGNLSSAIRIFVLETLAGRERG